jgi:hypothetical protein
MRTLLLATAALLIACPIELAQGEEPDGSDIVILAVQKRDAEVRPVLQAVPADGVRAVDKSKAQPPAVKPTPVLTAKLSGLSPPTDRD